MTEPAQTFTSLAVGESNELAVSAARRVAEAPGRIYNPLLITGPSGAGKTHLLRAIAAAASSADPTLLVHLQGAADFADRVGTATIAGDLKPLRDALSAVDLFLLDDLERLEGRRRTQEELHRILRELMNRSAQVVVTSEQPPADLTGLLPELIATFNRGLSADVALPDSSTRRQIILRLLARAELAWSEEAIDALSQYSLHPAALLARIGDLGHGVDDPVSLTAAEVHHDMSGEPRDKAPTDEFGDFLEDVGRVVAAVVETEPWRRRVAEAILRWEGEGITTTRLDRALESESIPDVDALLDGFARDAERLLEIRRTADPESVPVDDPDDLDAAERSLVEAPTVGLSSEPPAAGTLDGPADSDLLDPRRVVLDVVDIEGRLVEHPG